MRCVVQKVSNASVVIDGNIVGEIQQGLCVLAAFRESDSIEIFKWFANKLVNLRVFPDEIGKMNKSVNDIQGGLLIVSNFTLYGDASKGFRPSYTHSASAEIAIKHYEQFIAILKETTDLKVATGEFGAMMKVELCNDGPVTLIIDKD